MQQYIYITDCIKQHIPLSESIPKYQEGYQSDRLKKHIIFVACHGRAVLYYFDKQLDSLRALPQRINDWHIACYPFANHFVFI